MMDACMYIYLVILLSKNVTLAKHHCTCISETLYFNGYAAMLVLVLIILT